MDPRNANKQLDESIKDNGKELAKGNHEQLHKCIEHYEFVKELGKGSQGTVNLYKRKTDGETYAIKQFTIDNNVSFTGLQRDSGIYIRVYVQISISRRQKKPATLPCITH